MDQTPTSTPPRLFNDVYFQRWEPPAPCDASWALFTRLPAELRLHVWLACLQRNRMIELDICHAPSEEPTTYPGDGSQYYTTRNSLGNIVSGRGYVLSWSSPCRRHDESPLLWVNREARRVTLGFYSIRLPFFASQKELVLYLNPEYDVVSIRPRDKGPPTTHEPLTLLADFLHDVKAYDRKGQGIAHLALSRRFLSLKFIHPTIPPLHFQLKPAALHPVAAASFADILQHRLRSVLFAIPFRTCYRGLAEIPTNQAYQFHFAQTFPLARRHHHPAGAFHWLDTDPRPGVEIDIRQMPLGLDPRQLTRDWKQLELAFGVTRPTEQQQENNKAGTAGPGLYISPRIYWPWEQGRENEEEDNDEESGPRAKLARHLREEAEDWQHRRTWLHELFLRSRSDARIVPRQGYVLDAETFEEMERLPCTAVGMWVFPAEAFKEPTVPRRFCFDMSAAGRPGLFLFQV